MAKFNEEEINDPSDEQPASRHEDGCISKATCVPVKLKSPSWVVCSVLIHRSKRPRTLIFSPPSPLLPANVSTGNLRDACPWQMLLKDGSGLCSLFFLLLK